MDYIQKSYTRTKMENTYVNNATKSWRFPTMPAEDIINTFSEDLKEIVPQKLDALLQRQDILLKERTENLKFLPIIKGEFEQYWFALQTEIDFAEYDVIQRWLKYWLRLAMKSGNNRWAEENSEELSEEVVARAKETPIMELFEGRLRKIGARYSGLCPFHKENTPSFVIFETDNSFYCFGCHVWGDAIDFYMKLNECNFVKAVKALS